MYVSAPADPSPPSTSNFIPELPRKQLGQAADQTEISVRLAVIIEEVLASMGRGKDFNAMKETLEANIITTTDDIMVLTQNYCESISIPWGFVVACKQKVRASKAHNDDSWTFPNKDEQPVEREFAALPPQVRCVAACEP